MTQENHSPISKLHEDLLWSIFLINAYTRHGDHTWTSRIVPPIQDRPLTVLRRSSQVCREWRRIILGSPSLWGNVVDMTLLCSLEGDDWLNEIIRRSGEQFLHITTDNVEGFYRRIETLAQLLDDHWERIRSLNVTIWLDWPDIDTAFEILQTLRRPTKILQSFKFEFKHEGLFGPAALEWEAKPPLFSDFAPSLTAFHCTNYSLNLDCPSPWLSQLRTLHISFETRSYAVSNILEALRGSSTLETLILQGKYFRSQTTALPKNSVTLPNLKVIGLFTGYIMAATAVLDTLIVPSNCTVIVFTEHQAQTEDELDLPKAYQILHGYIQSYSNSYNNTALLLSIASHGFEFHGVCSLLGASHFVLQVSSGSFPFSDRELNCILSSLAGCKFDNVKFADLDISSSNIRPDNPDLVRCLSGFSSLGMMELEEPTLAFLTLNTSDIRPPVFPKLLILKISKMPLSPFSSGPLLPFLKWRRYAGIPVGQLDFTDLDFTTFPQDLDFLEEMKHLEVIWYATSGKVRQSYREYWCGSGDPGLLRGIGSIDNANIES